MDSAEGWKNASEWTYDGNKTLGLEEEDTNFLTGRIVGADHNWTYVFDDLPGVVQGEDGEYIFLEYRVIEAGVSWGNGDGQSQIISLPTTGADEDQFDYHVDKSLVTGATFSHSSNTSTSTNQLSTTSVSVTKVWDDTNNQYGTRPGAEAPWTWSSWFVLQRSTDNADWKNVAVFDKLYGSNAERKDDADSSGTWTAELTGLPTMDFSASPAQKYTYRVRELQPKDGSYTSVSNIENGDIVEDKGIYNPEGSQYIASYTADGQNNWTVKNSLDLYIPEGEVSEVTARKQWAVPVTDATKKPDVTFQLQYKTDGGDWTPTNFENTNQTANEENNWTVRWERLPDTIGGQTVTYRVVELDGGGWVQINQPVTLLSGEEATYTFTNTLSRDYAVEKVWNPSGAATHEITLALYRTTDAEAVGSLDGEPVPADELDLSEGVLKVMLSGNSWTHTFQNLPRYNANSQLYYYYALELDSSGDPIPRNGKITQNGTDYEVSYDNRYTYRRGWEQDHRHQHHRHRPHPASRPGWSNGNVYGTSTHRSDADFGAESGNWKLGTMFPPRYTPAWIQRPMRIRTSGPTPTQACPAVTRTGIPTPIRCGRLFPPGIRSRAGPTAALQMSSPAP